MDNVNLQLYSFGFDCPLTLLEKIKKAGEMGYAGVEFARGYQDIPVEDVPLVVIPDEEVPVADVPQTGDDSGLWYVLLMASFTGLAVMGWLEIRDRKKTTVD